MRSTFKILFYANKGKEKDGIVPIMGWITINGTQCQFSCKHSIALAMWDVKGRSNLFALPLQRTVPRDAARKHCRLTVTSTISRCKSSSTISICGIVRRL